MNIVLLDDSSNHNQQLRKSLSLILEDSHISAVISLEATTLEEVLEYSASNPPPTVYFLDIRLEQEQTGLEICRKLQRKAVRDQFVFVSAYPHYAMDCLKVHAFDFLLKPVDPAALRDCVLALNREIMGNDESVLEVQIGSRIIRLPIRQIAWLEALGRNVCIHTIQGNYTYVESLSRLEQILARHQFIRIHRKYIINNAFVEEWDTATDEVLVNGARLPMSRRMQKRLTGKKS